MLSSSHRYIDMMTGRAEQLQRARPQALSAGPTFVKISDALEDAEDIVAELDAATPEGRRRNRHLSRRRAAGIGRSPDGTLTYNGRACCLTLARKLDPHLHTLPIPSQHTCPACGTVWELQITVREERPHGR